MAYLTVQVSVVINAWYGPFYDDVQKALGGGGEVTSGDLYGHLLTFCIIVLPYILFVPFKIVSKFVISSLFVVNTFAPSHHV